MSEQSFSRGGYPLSGDPTMARAMHTGPGKPHCTACGGRILGDEDYLPNKCMLDPNGQHTYPNGEKAPNPIVWYPDVPDDHTVFLGTDLTSGTGFRTGRFDLDPDLIHALVGYPQDSEDFDTLKDAANTVWATKIVAPIVRTYLLPQVTFEHTLVEAAHGNPIRITHIAGREVRAVGAYETYDLLGKVYVSLSTAHLVSLAHHYASRKNTGVPDEVAIPAYMAGLSAREVRDRYANGTLHPDAVDTLLALRD